MPFPQLGLLYILSLGAPLPLGRFPGWYGPTLYAPAVLYSLAINPIMVGNGMQLDTGDTIKVIGGHLPDKAFPLEPFHSHLHTHTHPLTQTS